MNNFNLGYNTNGSSAAETISFGTEKYSPQAGGGIIGNIGDAIGNATNTFLGLVGLGDSYEPLWTFAGVSDFPELLEKLKNNKDLLTKRDCDGNTILHILSSIPDVASENVKDVLECGDLKKMINVQNKAGDTVAHVALNSGNENLIGIFTGCGIDLSKENSNGDIVATDSAGEEKENTVVAQDTDITKTMDLQTVFGSKAMTADSYTANSFDAPAATNNANINIGIASPSEAATEAAPMPAPMPATASAAGGHNTEAFLNSLVQKYNVGPIMGGADANTINITIDPLSEVATETNTLFNNMVGGNTISLNINPLSNASDALLDNMVNKFGGGMTENADEFINSMVDSYLHSNNSRTQGGGSYARGQRTLNLYAEGGRKKKSKSKKKSRSRSRSRSSGDDFKYGKVARQLGELGRQINDQVNEIHKRVIQKIIELMKVDDETARTYKSGLWQTLKDNFGDKWNELSQLDRATELEKFALKKNINKIDLEGAKKIRDENRRLSEERRNARKSEKKPKKQRKPRTKSDSTSAAETLNLSDASYSNSGISSTSNVSVPNMSYSETSFSV